MAQWLNKIKRFFVCYINAASQEVQHQALFTVDALELGLMATSRCQARMGRGDPGEGPAGSRRELKVMHLLSLTVHWPRKPTGATTKFKGKCNVIMSPRRGRNSSFRNDGSV